MHHVITGPGDRGNRGRETGHCLLSASVCQRTNRFICVATSDERVAQLVERPAKKPFAILTRVRVPCEARDFAPKSALSANPFSVSVQPQCAITCTLSVRTLTVPNCGTTPLSGHRKIPHTLVGVCSVALAAAVSYPDKATRISRKGQ